MKFLLKLIKAMKPFLNDEAREVTGNGNNLSQEGQFSTNWKLISPHLP